MMKKMFTWIAVIILLVEEWLWDVLNVIGEKLAVKLHLLKLERFIKRLNPYPSLFVLCISSFIVTPFNLYALYMIAHGFVVQGIMLEIIMKLVSTLIVSRTFNLTKPKLLQIEWFAVCYAKVMSAINWAHVKIKQTAVYAKALEMKSAIKLKYQSLKLKFSVI